MAIQSASSSSSTEGVVAGAAEVGLAAGGCERLIVAAVVGPRSSLFIAGAEGDPIAMPIGSSEFVTVEHATAGSLVTCLVDHPLSATDSAEAAAILAMARLLATASQFTAEVTAAFSFCLPARAWLRDEQHPSLYAFVSSRSQQCTSSRSFRGYGTSE